MKKKLFYFSIFGVFLLTLVSISVMAFDLVEGIPLHSRDRQEARIDDNWLLIEETNSRLDGFLYHYPGNNTGGGSLSVFYEGHNLLGEYHYSKSVIEMSNVWVAQCYPLPVDCYHFEGLTNADIDLLTYKDAVVSGFFNPYSKQIYVRYVHDDLGMTWVTFMREGLEIPTMQAYVTGRR